MSQNVDNPFALAKSSEGGTALAQSEESRAIAEVQAALVVARKFPRNPKEAGDRILNMCTRESLAETALYSYSRGGSEITGPSIRLAEAIAQAWGNVEFGFRELSRGKDPDGVTYSDILAYAWDLETNTRRPVSFRARHWRDTKKGGNPITAERDIYEMTANMAQRRVRACILSVLPGDIVEAAVHQCEVTLASSGNTTPEAIKKLVDAFAAIGVTKEQIEGRIQCRVEAIRSAQVVQLRKIYASIKDGMSTAVDWFDAPSGGASAPGSESAPSAAPEALPALAPDRFEADLPKWRDLIESGRQTADGIVAMVSSRFALSDEQIARIREPVAAPAADDNDDFFAAYDAATEATP